ncbi:UNVERIFIED_CONTAM: hypothetical protein RF653_11675 [Kocuria sp. CPCC 205316]|uniref:hypothetical protein n=1 Tax=Kocuria TaxID=57493 RepID=UPI0036D8EC68
MGVSLGAWLLPLSAMRHGRYGEHKNGGVDVVVEYRHHGHWTTKTYEDTSLEKAASIAKEKCHGGNWRA